MRKLVSILTMFTLLVWFGSAASAATSVIKTSGDEMFVPNALIQSTLKFVPGPVRVASGGTLTWVHADRTPAPHTVSIVDASDLPDDIEEVFGCEVCGEIFEAHSAGGFTPVVDTGAPGLDTRLDSFFFEPGQEVSMVVSAPAGSTLYYLCAIHAWMQGSITVA